MFSKLTFHFQIIDKEQGFSQFIYQILSERIFTWFGISSDNMLFRRV